MEREGRWAMEGWRGWVCEWVKYGDGGATIKRMRKWWRRRLRWRRSRDDGGMIVKTKRRWRQDDGWMDGALTEGLCRRQFQSCSGLRDGGGGEVGGATGGEKIRPWFPAGGEKGGRKGKRGTEILTFILSTKPQPGGDKEPVSLSNHPAELDKMTLIVS